MNVVIVRPVITEQSMAAAQTGKFTFLVARSAHKDAIKREVEQSFGVKVLHVATTIIKGKTKRTGVRRMEVKVSPMKKAVVKLSPGQKINLFELGGESK